MSSKFLNYGKKILVSTLIVGLCASNVTFAFSYGKGWYTDYKSSNSWGDVPTMPGIGDYDFPTMSGIGDYDFPTMSGLGDYDFPTMSGIGDYDFPTISGIGDYDFPTMPGLDSAGVPTMPTIPGIGNTDVPATPTVPNTGNTDVPTTPTIPGIGDSVLPTMPSLDSAGVPTMPTIPGIGNTGLPTMPDLSGLLGDFDLGSLSGLLGGFDLGSIGDSLGNLLGGFDLGSIGDLLGNLLGGFDLGSIGDLLGNLLGDFDLGSLGNLDIGNLFGDLLGDINIGSILGGGSLEADVTNTITMDAKTAVEFQGTGAAAKLSATVYMHNEPTSKWVLLVHPFLLDGTAIAGSVGPFYYEKGYNIIAPDLRGFGNSEGSVALGCLESMDIYDWLVKLNADYDVSQVFVHGISLGGATTNYLSGIDRFMKNGPTKIASTLKPIKELNVVGLVEDCGYVDMTEFASKSIVMSFSGLAEDTFDYYSNATNSLKYCEVPMLIIHGTGDTTVDPENAQIVADTVNNNHYNGTAEIWSVSGGVHAFIVMGSNTNEYRAHVQAFIDKNAK